jgi:hypothetical protein
MVKVDYSLASYPVSKEPSKTTTTKTNTLPAGTPIASGVKGGTIVTERGGGYRELPASFEPPSQQTTNQQSQGNAISQMVKPPVDPLGGYVPQYGSGQYQGQLMGFYKGGTFIPKEAALTNTNAYNPSAVLLRSSQTTADGKIINRYAGPGGNVQEIRNGYTGDVQYQSQPKFEGGGQTFYYSSTSNASYEVPEVLAQRSQPLPPESTSQQTEVVNQDGIPYSTVSPTPSKLSRAIGYANLLNPLNIIDKLKERYGTKKQKTQIDIDKNYLYDYVPSSGTPISGTMKSVPHRPIVPSSPNFYETFVDLGNILNPINLATKQKYSTVATDYAIFKPLEKIGITETSIGRQAALYTFGKTSVLGPVVANEFTDTKSIEIKMKASYDVPSYQKSVSGFASQQYKALREDISYPVKSYGVGLLFGGTLGSLSKMAKASSVAEFASQASTKPLYVVKFGSKGYGNVLVGAKNIASVGKTTIKYGAGAVVFGTAGYNIVSSPSYEEFGRRVSTTSTEFILFGYGAKEGMKFTTPYKEVISKAKILPSKAMEKQIVKTSDTKTITTATGETFNIKSEIPETTEAYFKRTTQIIPEQYRITTPFNKFFGEAPIKEVLGTTPRTVSIGESLSYTKLGDPYILLERTPRNKVVKFVSGTGKPIDFKTFYQEATPIQKRLFKELVGLDKLTLDRLLNKQTPSKLPIKVSSVKTELIKELPNTEKISLKMFRAAEEGSLGEVSSQILIRNKKLPKPGKTIDVAESLTRSEQLTAKEMERYGFNEDNIVGFEMYKSQTVFKRTTKPNARSTGNIDKLNTVIVRKLPKIDENNLGDVNIDNLKDIPTKTTSLTTSVLSQNVVQELPKTPPPKVKAPSYRLKTEPDKYIFPQSKYAGLGQYERQESSYANAMKPITTNLNRNFETTRPIEMTRYNVRNIEVLKPMNSEITRGMFIEINKEISKELNKEINKEMNKEMIKLMGKEVQKQMQKEQQKEMQKQMFKQPPTSSTNRFRQPPTGPPPKIPLLNFKRNTFKPRLASKGYSVLQKRRGVFVPIATKLPRGVALKFGSDRTLRDLSRTFKVVQSGTTEMEDINFGMIPSQFRDYRVRKGRAIPTDTFIQRQGTLLQTPEEKEMIRQARWGLA